MVQRADINQEMLIWAREASGLDIDDAAKSIGISVERLAAWERGEALPTVRQLRLVGKAYRRPSAFFYLKQAPPKRPDLPDFRLFAQAEFGKSPELLYEIRLAHSRRETAIEVFAQLGEEAPSFQASADIGENPASVAKRMRDTLGVAIETQMSWKDHYEALHSWINAVEASGILVCQFSGIETSEARGFSIGAHPLPVISINGQDSPRGRIFTLFHELAHLALDQGGLCDLHDTESGKGDVEPYCNQIAGELLVPSNILLSQDLVESNTTHEWPEDILLTLSNRFMVSREVILRRLLTLRRTTAKFYERKRKQFIEEYAQRQKGGFLEFFRKVLRNNGVAYTSLLLDAYRNEVITLRDLSRYLGDIKLKHIESIEHELGFHW